MPKDWLRTSRSRAPDNIAWTKKEKHIFLRDSLETPLTIIEDLLTELKRLDSKPIRTDVHLLESKVYRGMRNITKAKVPASSTLRRTRATSLRSSSRKPPPRLFHRRSSGMWGGADGAVPTPVSGVRRSDLQLQLHSHAHHLNGNGNGVKRSGTAHDSVVDRATSLLMHFDACTPSSHASHSPHACVNSSPALPHQREHLAQTGLGDREPIMCLAAWFEFVLADPADVLPRDNIPIEDVKKKTKRRKEMSGKLGKEMNSWRDDTTRRPMHYSTVRTALQLSTWPETLPSYELRPLPLSLECSALLVQLEIEEKHIRLCASASRTSDSVVAFAFASVYSRASKSAAARSGFQIW
ncbi:hypothetical protein B0H19DRAFT_1253151 [Mycena capillaripes]|nr:hypothetical protein B0H19DRAFT_1253151 [Mycena capillaripes]